MTTRSNRLAEGNLPLLSPATIVYTCPAGKRIIVRSIILGGRQATGSGSAQIRFSTTAGPYRLVFGGSIAAAGTVIFDTWSVLEPDDRIILSPSSTTALDYWISGAELPDA
jgi:hypothetical protein